MSGDRIPTLADALRQCERIMTTIRHTAMFDTGDYVIDGMDMASLVVARDAARAALAGVPAEGQPVAQPGWRLVPVELTRDMQRIPTIAETHESIWNAFLAAAPQPPEPAREPSDEEIEALWGAACDATPNNFAGVDGIVRNFARAVRAWPNTATQPAPNICHWPTCACDRPVCGDAQQEGGNASA